MRVPREARNEPDFPVRIVGTLIRPLRRLRPAGPHLAVQELGPEGREGGVVPVDVEQRAEAHLPDPKHRQSAYGLRARGCEPLASDPSRKDP